MLFVAIKRYGLAILILIMATVVVNCVCLSFVGLNSLNYPRHWYNASFDQASAPNVTVLISAKALGDTPIYVLDSDSNLINISVFYYTAPVFKDIWHNDNLTIAAFAHYTSDWTEGVGADIYVYLPGSANYTMNIENWAAPHTDSVYTKSSPMLANYTRGNLTVWLNDPAHPVPRQAYDLY